MNYGQLKQMIAFEAKIPDVDALSGWLELVIQGIFDEYTSLVKYPELFVSNAEIPANLPNLPTTLQHLDLDNIRYRPGGDSTQDYILRVNNRVYGEDSGPSRYVQRLGSVLQFFPTAEIIGTDRIVFNYWKHSPIEGAADTAALVPEQLITTVLKDAVVRAMALSDSKQAGLYRQLARDAHGRSLGATDVGSMNG